MFTVGTAAAGICNSSMISEIGIDPPALPEAEPETPFNLAEIYDREIERTTKAAYQRDYMLFGFGPWSEEPAT